MTSLSSPNLSNTIRLCRDQLCTYIDDEIVRLDEGYRIAVLVVEVSNLSKIDQQLGYRIGDLLLRSVEERLDKSITKAHLTSQMDRSKFALAIPGLKSERLLPVAAEKIRLLLETPFDVEEHHIIANCTTGIAVALANGNSRAHDVLLEAQASVEQAHRARQPFLIASPEIRQSSIPELDKAELLKAQSADEFTLLYQPKVDLKTRQPSGYEALLRWQPEGHDRPVNTEHFIAMAQSQNLMGQITEWVVKTAIREAGVLMSKEKGIGMSLNISASDIHTAGLLESIIGYLGIWKVRPEMLTIEVTESTLMENPEQCSQVLSLMRDKGIRVSIDDFGTGYSSLAYFKNVPADEIKIDQAFIRKLDTSPADQALVSTITSLAHRFGMKVVCEGVENSASLKILESLGCDYAQGYLFAKPCSTPQLKHWLKRFDYKNYTASA